MTVGVDIEDISRFINKSPEFLNRVFTALELDYCMKFARPESHLAARFCAKEAVIKALTALDIKNISMSDIEVYHNENKCPNIRILKKLDKDINFELSLSHDKTKAIAFVNAKEQ